MSEGGVEAGGAGGAGGAEGGGGGERAAQHARCFKLRFAAQREQGRSYVSLVKPLGLPATVTGKFYSRETAPARDAELRALRRVRELAERGPRERLPAPRTASHEYGWWASRAAPPSGDGRLDHRIRDSAWLKGRLLVLAADEKLKRK